MLTPTINIIRSKAEIELELQKAGIEPNPGPVVIDEEADEKAN